MPGFSRKQRPESFPVRDINCLMAITSPHNAKITFVRALLSRRRERDHQQVFVVEGVRLVEEALLAGWQIEIVLFSPKVGERGRSLIQKLQKHAVDIEETTVELLHSLSATETSQGILAVVQKRELLLPPRLDFVVIADAMRDPGNLGTLLRTCAAANVQAVLLSNGSVDAFSPKVVRSAMGAHFHLPILIRSWPEIVSLCDGSSPSLRMIAADAAQGTNCWATDLKQPLALVIGGEAEGLSTEARQFMHAWVRIPMPGKSESLNAAVAASILIFEIVRQRYK
jgi:TrmH family RNA methyltransferase